MARFDQVLRDAPSPLPDLWLAGARVREAAAAARLDGAVIDEERVALLEASGNAGLVESGDRWALTLLAVLRHLDQCPADECLTPGGLAGLWRGLGRRVPDDAEAPQGPLAAWVETWRDLASEPGLPSLPAVGLGLKIWLEHAPAGGDSPALGRLLPALLARDRFVVHRPWLMLAAVTRGWGGTFQDPGPGPWLRVFFETVGRAAEDAAGHFAALKGRRERWLRRIGPRRAGSRLGAAADLALSVPVLSRALLMGRLDLSPRGAGLLLEELVGLGLVREISGRSRFRFFRPTG